MMSLPVLGLNFYQEGHFWNIISSRCAIFRQNYLASAVASFWNGQPADVSTLWERCRVPCNFRSFSSKLCQICVYIRVAVHSGSLAAHKLNSEVATLLLSSAADTENCMCLAYVRLNSSSAKQLQVYGHGHHKAAFPLLICQPARLKIHTYYYVCRMVDNIFLSCRPARSQKAATF